MGMKYYRLALDEISIAYPACIAEGMRLIERAKVRPYSTVYFDLVRDGEVITLAYKDETGIHHPAAEDTPLKSR